MEQGQGCAYLQHGKPNSEHSCYKKDTFQRHSGSFLKMKNRVKTTIKNTLDCQHFYSCDMNFCVFSFCSWRRKLFRKLGKVLGQECACLQHGRQDFEHSYDSTDKCQDRLEMHLESNYFQIKCRGVTKNLCFSISYGLNSCVSSFYLRS